MTVADLRKRTLINLYNVPPVVALCRGATVVSPAEFVSAYRERPA
jgi:hypothetical protein